MISEVSYKFGINVIHDNKRICLNPTKEIHCDLIFVSHAHTDHLHQTTKLCAKPKIITSNVTSRIAKHRGYVLGTHFKDHNFHLLDSGHILGSKALLIEDELYYTGDISIRSRAFMKPAAIPRAKILVIESTFGIPDYIFPKIGDIIHEANYIISKMYNEGIPVVLTGYALGKAQILSYIFKHWEPIYVHDSIREYNKIYSKFGVDIQNYKSFYQAETEGLLSPNRPWLLIAPQSSSRKGFLYYVKEKYNPIIIGFSGWAVRSNYKYILGLDYCLPLSDHCDYTELLTVVKKCDPDMIYTFHGFADQFALSLTKMGYNAASINRKKRST